MSIIGSGPGIGTGKLEVSGLRAITGGEARPATAASTQAAPQPAATHSNQAAAVVTSTALNAGEMPVDGQRVSQIKKAIQSGTYPVLPVKISDAMIAAGFLLQQRT